MKTKILSFLLILTLFPLFISPDSIKNDHGSKFLFAQVGLNSYTGTDDPFDRFPYLGFGFEICVKDRFGVGGSIFYGKWSDYLGMYCGKFTFQVVRPSLDLTYHFNLKDFKKVELFGGANFGYNFIRVDNELNNECDSDLKNQVSISPFVGCHLYFFEKASSFLKRMAISLKLFWTVNGDFSGIYGMAGISCRLK